MIDHKNSILSENSVIFSHLSETTIKSAGKFNPIDLPSLDIRIIGGTIGAKITNGITNGNIGTIYKVNDCFPSRVYKAISLDRFENGDEIRITKIAGELGVAPAFYGAVLAQQNTKTFVVIEMDDSGQSLGKLMEEFSENTEIHEAVVVEETPLTDEEKAFQEMLKKIQAKYSSIVCTEIR